MKINTNKDFLKEYKNDFWKGFSATDIVHIAVGICGELGADTTLTERFIKMGIDELSVSPSMVLGVRSRICEME